MQQEAPGSAVISLLVDNESGALARIIGLFSGRGYNIRSLTVAPVDEHSLVSRVNIVTTGTLADIRQIKAQIERLTPVSRAVDLSSAGPHVAREMALIKVVSSGESRTEALRMKTKRQASLQELAELEVMQFPLAARLAGALHLHGQRQAPGFAFRDGLHDRELVRQP